MKSATIKVHSLDDGKDTTMLTELPTETSVAIQGGFWVTVARIVVAELATLVVEEVVERW